MTLTRPCILKIDLDALEENVNYYRSKTQTTIFGVIKANAYGHGDIMVAKHFETIGVPVLCVSSIDEARHLVRNGITADILIFGPVPYEAIEAYHQHQFIYTLASKVWFDGLPPTLRNLRFHLEINTGMNRLGFKNLIDVQAVLKSDHHRFEGIYTHFASADEATDFTMVQLDRFTKMIDALQYPFKWIHAGNSHGALSLHDSHINASRIGIGLYGFVESSLFKEDQAHLKKVLSLQAKIIHIDSMEPGETVGYNQTFMVKEPMRFGTLPIGYADGLNPLNRSCPLYINNQPRNIIGKICMDQLMIELEASDQLDDWVEIIGPNRTIEMIAHATNTIPYVVLSQLSDRIVRNYYIRGKCVKTIDTRNDT